jgi:hypothetical protein
MKTVAIIQPGYLPWLGFFELMASSDVFIIYDDVQFDKHGWRNRNRIKTPQGPQWLTVPVLTKGKNWPKNNQILVNGDGWKKKHLKSIEQNYCKAQFFNDFFPVVAKGLSMDSALVLDYSIFFIRAIAEFLGIKKELLLSSKLGIDGIDKAQRLLNVCKHFNATHYYNGAAGIKLYKKEDFLQQGLVLEFQDYRHPVYRQLHGDFIPYLSVIDLIFNEGPASLDIIMSGRNVV